MEEDRICVGLFLPSLKTVSNLAALVDCGFIQNDHSLLVYTKREVLHKFDEPIGVYVLTGSETLIDTIVVNHSEEIESSAFTYGHTEILIFEFPCIRHIPFGAYMAFITVIQVNAPRLPLMFKLLQKFLLISGLLRRGGSLRTFPYTSKSCAIADKKFLKAPSLICFPVASSQAALALDTLWRCCLIASLTASFSSLVLMMRLRPFPGLFFRPAMPSVLNLFTQCITRWYVCSARSPAAALLRPSALPNTIRHRIRNEWVKPFRYPFPKAALYPSVICILVACLDIYGVISIIIQ